MAIQFPGSRQMIFRKISKDVRSSIWKITLPAVLMEMDLKNGEDYESNEVDMEIRFLGAMKGSVIGCAGLDDKDRVDKVLGQEFSTIYINESHDVPYDTVTTLLTRLSGRAWNASRTLEMPTRFIADLNPTGVGHWTYKLWFLGKIPGTNADVPNHERYGKLKMSPHDNPNLNPEYIEDVLGNLTGNKRKRFLDGDYTSTDDLVVFQGEGLESEIFDKDFTEWRRGKRIEWTAGLDLGYNDADAFVVLAYSENFKEVWLVCEYKKRKSTVTDLQNDIQAILEAIEQKYRVKPENIPIYVDTGGGGKKVFSELESVYHLNVMPAYKRNKPLSIDLLQDEDNSGKLKTVKGGEWDLERSQIVWTREDDGAISRVIDDKMFHPDMMDALIYAFHVIWDYTSRDLIPEEENKPHFDPVLQKIFSNLQSSHTSVW